MILSDVITFWRKLNNQERIKLAMTIAAVPTLVVQLHAENKKRWLKHEGNGYFQVPQENVRKFRVGS